MSPLRPLTTVAFAPLIITEAKESKRKKKKKKKRAIKKKSRTIKEGERTLQTCVRFDLVLHFCFPFPVSLFPFFFFVVLPAYSALWDRELCHVFFFFL